YCGAPSAVPAGAGPDTNGAVIMVAKAPPLLEKLFGLIELVLREKADRRGEVDRRALVEVARGCLVELVRALEQLCEEAPDDLSVRQLLLRILKQVPKKGYREEAWSDTLRQVRECHSLKLLDQSCGHAAYEIGFVRYTLEG